MIALDANILIYSYTSSLPQHKAARMWLDAQLNGSAQVGFPWISIIAFLRLVTNPRVFERPAATADAWEQVEKWLECECSWTPQPTERHSEILGRLLSEPTVSGNLVSDAHLAALAIEHGLTLCTCDGDFARFPGLRWENPLKA